MNNPNYAFIVISSLQSHIILISMSCILSMSVGIFATNTGLAVYSTCKLHLQTERGYIIVVSTIIGGHLLHYS